jgi:hypothetical protein
MQHIARALALNESPLFIEALTQLCLNALSDANPCRLRLPKHWEAKPETAFWEPKTLCSPTPITALPVNLNKALAAAAPTTLNQEALNVLKDLEKGTV